MRNGPISTRHCGRAFAVSLVLEFRLDVGNVGFPTRQHSGRWSLSYCRLFGIFTYAMCHHEPIRYVNRSCYAHTPLGTIFPASISAPDLHPVVLHQQETPRKGTDCPMDTDDHGAVGCCYGRVDSSLVDYSRPHHVADNNPARSSFHKNGT